VAKTQTPDARARSVAIRSDRLEVELVDGRIVRVPYASLPRLAKATIGERQNYQLVGDGTLIHWPDIDEDIDVPLLLRG